MRTQEERQRFIQLRAEGLSYSKISGIIGISTKTAAEWGRKFEAEITKAKRKELAELGREYGMAKAARVKRLGGTLARIDETLSGRTFDAVPTEKLLSLQLQYVEALKNELGSTSVMNDNISDPKIYLEAFLDLLDRARAGDLTKEQAASETLIITNMLRAYDTIEVKAKIEEIERIIAEYDKD